MIAAFRVEWFKLRRRPLVLAFVLFFLAGLVVGTYLLDNFQYTGHLGVLKGRPGGPTLAQLEAGLFPAASLRHAFNVVQNGAPIVFVPLTFAAAAASSAAVAMADGGAVVWPQAIDIGEAMAATWLVFCFLAVFGAAIAFVTRQSALAVAVGLGYTLLGERLLDQLLMQFQGGAAADILRLLPGSDAGALANAVAGTSPGGLPSFVDPPTAVALLGIYTVFLASIAALAVVRRDVT